MQLWHVLDYVDGTLTTSVGGNQDKLFHHHALCSRLKYSTESGPVMSKHANIRAGAWSDAYAFFLADFREIQHIHPGFVRYQLSVGAKNPLLARCRFHHRLLRHGHEGGKLPRQESYHHNLSVEPSQNISPDRSYFQKRRNCLRHLPVVHLQAECSSALLTVIWPNPCWLGPSHHAGSICWGWIWLME